MHYFTSILFLPLLAFFIGGCGHAPPKLDKGALSEKSGKASIEVIASFKDAQPTGVTVADNGRIFANFPRWREGVVNSVVEIKPDGTSVPYPNQAWNAWTGAPRENVFTCVQSVVAYKNSLFVLDPASPELKGVKGQAALYEFDLATNELKQKWMFDEKAAPPRSYLNDLRVDAGRNLIYITDSGLGAIVVLNTKTGQARRVIEQHPSTKSEPVVIYPNGKPATKVNGLPARFHSDGIELAGDYLYYHAVTAKHFYRVPAKAVADAKMTSAQLAKKVEDLGETPFPDGLAVDKNENIYMADLEHNAIVYRDRGGIVSTLVQDKNLHWADTLAVDKENRLVFSDSRIDQVGPGRPATGYTFHIYRLKL